MKLIGDYERIADHAVNTLESAEEIRDKDISFSDDAMQEYRLISSAVSEILDLSYRAFADEDYTSARKTEPLEQVIDVMKEELRTRQVIRQQKGECDVSSGFVWSDLITDLERVSDHCSNISGCMLDSIEHTLNIHENQRIYRNADEDFQQDYKAYQQKYKL